MKQCPTCSQVYSDDTLNYCRHDGAVLAGDSSYALETQTTLNKLPAIGNEATSTEIFQTNAAAQVKTTASVRAASRKRRARKSKSVESLAVLPFVNAGADQSMEYLSDGITESIINALSQLPRLRVVARSTVFRYKGREIDLQEVGERLGVEAVITGRVRQVGNELMIAAELIDVRNDSQLWGERYNRGLSSLFDVQEEIASEIAAKLRMKLTGEEKRRLAKRYTENTEAYKFYLKGLYFSNKQTPEGIKKGIELFQQAIELDPAYALAYAGLSYSYTVIGLYGPLPPLEVVPKAKAAALKALEIDDQLAEAHASLALAEGLSWNLEGAKRGIKRSIELNPNYPIAHLYHAYYLAATGQLEEALAGIGRALALDPLSVVASDIAGFILHLARRYTEAIEQWHKTLELDPAFFRAHMGLGWAYTQIGRHEEAIAECQKAVNLSRGYPFALSALGHAFAVAGKRREALEVVGQMKTLSKQRYVSSYDIARVYTEIDKEEAFSWLEKAYDERHPWMLILKVAPAFDNLRGDPRFTDLLRRIGLDA